jgi:hypothetical protein
VSDVRVIAVERKRIAGVVGRAETLEGTSLLSFGTSQALNPETSGAIG